MTHPWEDVGGTPCPECGEPMGTIWVGAREVSSRGPIKTEYVQYNVEPHGRMGNKSHREDSCLGEHCFVCHYNSEEVDGRIMKSVELRPLRTGVHRLPPSKWGHPAT